MVAVNPGIDPKTIPTATPTTISVNGCRANTPEIPCSHIPHMAPSPQDAGGQHQIEHLHEGIVDGHGD